MKKHTIRTAILTCLATVLVLGAVVAPSLSYFTTYVTAQGGYPIHLGDVMTRIEEVVDASGNKEIRVQNIGETEVFVRVRVFSDSTVTVTFTEPDGGNHWYKDGDYWYYRGVLKPGPAPDYLGELTCVLKATITREGGLDEGYNVIVVQECTPALKDKNGDYYAVWDLKAEEG